VHGLLTRVIAAFCARIVGFGRAILGAGGGRAAVWGDAASGLRDTFEVGMMMCGWGLVMEGEGGDWTEEREDQADIIARRGHVVILGKERTAMSKAMGGRRQRG
jgi:hypothetical protein